MKLSIKKFRQIQRKITLELNKITVVTGVNGIGKTNISKILYCLLKSNCYNRYEPALESINKQIDELIKKIRVHNKIDLYLPEPLKDEFEYIDNYKKLKEEFKKEHYGLYKGYYKEDFELVDKLINILYEDGLELHVSIIRTLLKGMFGTNNFTGEISLQDDNDDDSFYNLDFSKDFYDDQLLEYNSGCLFEDVFYIDNSGTLLDYMEYNSIFNCSHNDDIISACNIDKSDLFSSDDDLIKLEEELINIMGGYFKWGDKGLVFKSNCDGQQYSMDNVSSGVKSLGCLYLLLHNNHIKSDSFIIFDEIENNLHSDNKILLANWLCRLVKKVGVNIYVNTKSPMFMEAIEVYSMKHKIEDDVSYILLDYSKDNMVKAFNTNRWNVKVLYDNLGDPYDILDKQRIENTFNL